MSIEEAEELCARDIATGVSGVFFAPFEHTTDNEIARFTSSSSTLMS